MIQVCYYKGCGVIYGEKEPLSDKRITHGLCPKHLEISLKEIKAQMEKQIDATRKFRVLIVEDSTLFRQLFKEVLNNRFPSVEVYEATEGGEALLQVETLRPNLIFMDIRLPGENGLQLTKKIKAQFPDMIVIIITNYDLQEYREAAFQYNANHFLSKGSATKEDILTLVDSILSDRGAHNIGPKSGKS